MKFKFYVLPLAALALLVACSEPPKQEIPENLEVQGIPAFPQDLIDKTERYLDVRNTSFTGWSNVDDGMYVMTRLENTRQVYYVAEPNAELVQITDFEEPVGGMDVDPREGKDGFLFTKDVGGSEMYQVYYFDRETGEHTMLTDGESRNGSLEWMPSGKHFAFASNMRNGKDTDVWLMNPDNPEEKRLLTEREGLWNPIEWSPDETRLLVINYVSANESRVYIVDAESGDMTDIYPDRSQKVSVAFADWGKDGKKVYFTSDHAGEFKSIYEYDVASGSVKPFLPESKWDVDGFRLTHAKDKMAYITNEDGISQLHIIDMQTKEEEPVGEIPIGLIGGVQFTEDDARLSLTIYRPVAPADAYSLDMETRTLTRWTDSSPEGIDPDSFVDPQLVHYPTFDSVDGAPRMIPAFYYKPKSPADTYPVIIDIHGGPEAQSRPWFSSMNQYYLSELEAAVLVPNVRGSDGYGKSYLLLDNDYNRENSVKDIGALLDWIAEQPELDENRVAVMGGSYGGYMVLATMTNYPERIKCGIEVVGISNFVTFLKNTKEYRRDLRRVEYGDERIPEMEAFLQEISPTNNAHKISKPLFVAQGENDPRVPASEARQIIKALEDKDIPVWYMFAADEGHGFAKRTNRDYYNRATVMFFKKFLL